MRQRHAFIVILILLALVFRPLEVGGQEWYPKAGENAKYFKEEEVRKEGRSLAAFQVCSGCTCCTGGRAQGQGQGQGQVCSKWSCCYSITCGLPDKPYGVCAFTPNSCNCTACGSGSGSHFASGSGTMAYPVKGPAKLLEPPSPSQSQSTRNSSSSSSSSSP